MPSISSRSILLVDGPGQSGPNGRRCPVPAENRTARGCPRLELRRQVQTEGRGIAEDLRRVLVGETSRPGLPCFSAPSRSSCIPRTVFPAPGSRRPSWSSRRRCRRRSGCRAPPTPMGGRCGRGLNQLAAHRSLHPAENFRPHAIGDLQRVFAGLVILPALFTISTVRMTPPAGCSCLRMIPYRPGTRRFPIRVPESFGLLVLPAKSSPSFVEVQRFDELLQ